MDDRHFGGEVFVILSLVSDCTMTLSRESNPSDFIRVPLPRLSLEIMSKEVVNTTHAIQTMHTHAWTHTHTHAWTHTYAHELMTYTRAH